MHLRYINYCLYFKVGNNSCLCGAQKSESTIVYCSSHTKTEISFYCYFLNSKKISPTMHYNITPLTLYGDTQCTSIK